MSVIEAHKKPRTKRRSRKKAQPLLLFEKLRVKRTKSKRVILEEKLKIARTKRVIDYSKIARYVWLGRNDMNWYQDCEKTFVDIFGRERLKLVAQIFAATSINSSLKSNIGLFRKALYQMDNGKPIKGYLTNIQTQLERIAAGKELSGRKINNFAKAMSGDINAVVVDVWLTRAFGIDRSYVSKSRKHDGQIKNGSPSDKDYDLIEKYIQHEAKRMSLEPRQLCSMIWAGVRIDVSGDKTTRYSDILLNKMKNLFSVI